MFSDRGKEDKAVIMVAAIIEKDGKLLMVQEGDPSVRGLWNVPAGHIEHGEDPIAAVRREVKEETGYDANPFALGRLYAFKYKNGVPALRFNFYCEIVGGLQQDKDEEILRLKWVEKEELEELHEEKKFRSEKTWWPIQDWIEGKKFPLESLKVLEEIFS